MAYSRVTVHVTDTEVELDGVVLTSTAKEQAAKIATEHAGGRKVKNKLKINPNTHPSGV
jgi:osmotically-inducible protein OsmY